MQAQITCRFYTLKLSMMDDGRLWVSIISGYLWHSCKEPFQLTSGFEGRPMYPEFPPLFALFQLYSLANFYVDYIVWGHPGTTLASKVLVILTLLVAWTPGLFSTEQAGGMQDHTLPWSSGLVTVNPCRSIRRLSFLLGLPP